MFVRANFSNIFQIHLREGYGNRRDSAGEVAKVQVSSPDVAEINAGNQGMCSRQKKYRASRPVTRYNIFPFASMRKCTSRPAPSSSTRNHEPDGDSTYSMSSTL